MVNAASTFWRDKVSASLIHLGLSVLIAALAALLVFGVWYPYPYREISGGRELFLLVVSVDVMMGPLITFAVFNRAKPRPELLRDLAIVALFQLSALGYGLWTVSVARPVHMVFEVDRFRVVHAIDVPPELLNKCPAGVVALPLTGPTMLSLRAPGSNQERSSALWAELAGTPMAARPDFWQPYSLATAQVLKAAHAMKTLEARFPGRVQEIDAAANAKGRQADDLLYLPLVGRGQYWTAFIDPLTADVVAAIPLDPF